MTDLRRSFPRKTRMDELGNEAYDVRTRTFGVIDAEHLRIHDEKHFEYSQYSPDIDTSKGCRIAFWVTGTAEDQHIFPDAGWSAAARLEVWENAKLTTTGVKPTLYNNYRSSTISGSQINLVIFSGIAIYNTAVSGTRIRVWYDGSAGVFGTGGAARRERELIIKKNSHYLLWLKPDANDLLGSLGLIWYEQESES